MIEDRPDGAATVKKNKSPLPLALDIRSTSDEMMILPVLVISSALSPSACSSLQEAIRSELQSREHPERTSAGTCALDGGTAADLMRIVKPDLTRLLADQALRGFGFRVGEVRDWRAFVPPALFPTSASRASRRQRSLLAYVHLDGPPPRLHTDRGQLSGALRAIGDAVVFSREIGIGLLDVPLHDRLGLLASLVEASA